MEFKGSKGVFESNEFFESFNHIIFTTEKGEMKDEVCKVYGKGENTPEEVEANVNLIIDAFNVRQKINFDLPELLDQRNQFLEMLIKANESLLNDSSTIEQIELRKEVEELIKKATTI